MEDITEFTEGLKKTLKGKNDTFFHINDLTNEIRQHYDLSYTPKFNSDKFIENYKARENSLNELGMDIETFIIPDKSILLKDNLPFETQKPRRNIDQINQYVHDLLDIMDDQDYIVNDIILRDSAVVKIVSYILSYLYPVKNMYQYSQEIMEKINMDFKYHKGILFTDSCWSYGKDDESYKKYENILTEKYDVNYIDSFSWIPRYYKIFNNKYSIHYKNEDSISDKKALILIKSASVLSLASIFSTYFTEVFFYNDFNYYNPYLVQWFKPDVILEIKDEKELETMDCPKFIPKFGNPLIPVYFRNSLSINNNTLSLSVNCIDLRKVPVNTNCQLNIDGKKTTNFDLINGKGNFKCDISDLEKGEHQLNIYLEYTNITKDKKIVKKFTVD